MFHAARMRMPRVVCSARPRSHWACALGVGAGAGAALALRPARAQSVVAHLSEVQGKLAAIEERLGAVGGVGTGVTRHVAREPPCVISAAFDAGNIVVATVADGAGPSRASPQVALILALEIYIITT